jgi:hypothetical protein
MNEDVIRNEIDNNLKKILGYLLDKKENNLKLIDSHSCESLKDIVENVDILKNISNIDVNTFSTIYDGIVRFFKNAKLTTLHVPETESSLYIMHGSIRFSDRSTYRRGSLQLVDEASSTKYNRNNVNEKIKKENVIIFAKNWVLADMYNLIKKQINSKKRVTQKAKEYLVIVSKLDTLLNIISSKYELNSSGNDMTASENICFSLGSNVSEKYKKDINYDKVEVTVNNLSTNKQDFISELKLNNYNRITSNMNRNYYDVVKKETINCQLVFKTINNYEYVSLLFWDHRNRYNSSMLNNLVTSFVYNITDNKIINVLNENTLKLIFLNGLFPYGDNKIVFNIYDKQDVITIINPLIKDLQLLISEDINRKTNSDKLLPELGKIYKIFAESSAEYILLQKGII